ncbi:AraC family transcriptional regulator [Clostridium sediminicola]|uniref:AraC family transcriptional regulator n=1 Tax=Clostridium sediminicola TaxID=3114879 RepID=UPI0031F211D3
MLEHIRINRMNLTDLDMYQCGYEECDSGHSYGPAVRDHYLIHFVEKGKGKFQVKGKSYELSKGEGFLICPNEVTFYKADIEEPWSYYWVGFHGTRAESYLIRANLTQNSPIFNTNNNIKILENFREMIKTKSLIKSREIHLLGHLYIFLAQLIESSIATKELHDDDNRKESYVIKAVEYIEKNYSREIRVHELADFIGIDRSYLTNLFKQFLNISPKQFLVQYRIEKACNLIKNTNLSIGDISRSVGYEDQLAFSKIFKKIKGKAPTKY